MISGRTQPATGGNSTARRVGYASNNYGGPMPQGELHVTPPTVTEPATPAAAFPASLNCSVPTFRSRAPSHLPDFTKSLTPEIRDPAHAVTFPFNQPVCQQGGEDGTLHWEFEGRDFGPGGVAARQKPK